MIDEALRTRWTTSDGRERRAAILADLPGGSWRAHLDGFPGADRAAGFADLRGVDLAGASLAGADLALTRLDGAVLRDTVLDGSQLAHAVFDGADARGLRGRALRAPALRAFGARFDLADLAESDLASANLAAARFRRALLRAACLRGASCAGADLIGADLTGTDLAGCDLEGALLGGSRRARRAQPHDAETVTFASFRDVLSDYLAIAKGRNSSAAAIIDAGVRASPQPEAEVLALLAAANWRVQVAGAAAAIALGPRPAVLEALWSAVDRGSWISPQAATAAFLLDDAFEARAGERLLGRTQSFAANGKSIAALVALWRRLPGKSANVAAAIDTARLPAAPEPEAGDIAIRWLAWAARGFDEPDVRARWIPGRANTVTIAATGEPC